MRGGRVGRGRLAVKPGAPGANRLTWGQRSPNTVVSGLGFSQRTERPAILVFGIWGFVRRAGDCSPYPGPCPARRGLLALPRPRGGVSLGARRFGKTAVVPLPRPPGTSSRRRWVAAGRWVLTRHVVPAACPLSDRAGRPDCSACSVRARRCRRSPRWPPRSRGFRGRTAPSGCWTSSPRGGP